MPVLEGTTITKYAQAEYDFAVDGGAISTITLRGGGQGLGNTLPNGAVILFGYIDVLTALTSGGAATIAVNSEAAADILAATAVASWTTGRKNVLPGVTAGAFTASTTIKTTAARAIAIAIAGAALTAGKFTVVLAYR